MMIIYRSVGLLLIVGLLAIPGGRSISYARSLNHKDLASAVVESRAESMVDCPIIFPAGPVPVAPNQPAVPAQSMVGVINALCDVTLDFVGCGFFPTIVTLNCDANGDGIPELNIPLKNITVVNRLLLQATLPALPSTPGTAFPLACCGGDASITMIREWNESDDNIFGPFAQTLTCPVNLGLRAPVVISASPSEGDCTLGQNLIIPGACFLLADGKPNVTSVFAVELGNPSNVVQATAVQIINGNLIDAFFKPGSANAGKTFLIFVSGPNGTSRNLTALPPNAAAGCPLGNEQGITVSFKCRSAGPASGGGGAGEGSAPFGLAVSGCKVERDEAGSFSLSVFGTGFRSDATVTVGGAHGKKIKFREPAGDGSFTSLQVKKKFCGSLPGQIVVTNPDGSSSAAFFCGDRCSN